MTYGRKGAKTIANALECYRMNIDPMTCGKRNCPYNNADPEHGYYCCANGLLHDAAQRLLYQEEKIKRLERKIDRIWTGRRR